MRKTMRYELLIIFCVSFLNSLTVERQRSYDRIFGVSDEKCDMFYGDEEDNICECSEDKKNTFLSTDNYHNSCSNEEKLNCKKILAISNPTNQKTRTIKEDKCAETTSIKIWNLQRKEEYGEWLEYSEYEHVLRKHFRKEEQKLVFDVFNTNLWEGHLLKVTIAASNGCESKNIANGECCLIKFLGKITYPANVSQLFPSTTSVPAFTTKSTFRMTSTTTKRSFNTNATFSRATVSKFVPTSFPYTRNTGNSPLVTTKRILTLKNSSIGELPSNDHSKDNNIVTVTAIICVVLLLVIVVVGMFLWVKRKRLPKGSVASNMKKFLTDRFIGHPDRLKPKESGEIIYATLEEQQEDQKVDNFDEIRSHQESHVYREIDQNSVCQTPVLPNKVDNQNIHSEGKVKQYASLNPITPEPYHTLRSSFPQNQVDEKQSSNKNNRDDYTPLAKINEQPYEQLCKSDHRNGNGSLPQYISNTLYEELEPTSPLYKTLEALDSNRDFS